MRRFVLTLMLSVLPVSVLAQDEFLPDIETEEPLSAGEVTDMFSDQTHRGTYNFEFQNFIGYRFEETTTSDGKTIHRLGARVDIGTWIQTDNIICFEYESEDLTGACFKFYQRGNCIYHHQQTDGGQMASRFTAVSVIKGESPNCEPPLV